jgi:hypothetical protein
MHGFSFPTVAASRGYVTEGEKQKKEKRLQEKGRHRDTRKKEKTQYYGDKK